MNPESEQASRKQRLEGRGCRDTIHFFHRHFDMSPQEKEVNNNITVVIAEFHYYLLLLQIQGPGIAHAGLKTNWAEHYCL